MIDELEANGQTPKDLLLQGMEELGLGNDPSTLDITFSLAGTDSWFVIWVNTCSRPMALRWASTLRSASLSGASSSPMSRAALPDRLHGLGALASTIRMTF